MASTIMVSTWPGERCLESCFPRLFLAMALDALNDECIRLFFGPSAGCGDPVASSQAEISWPSC